MFISSKFLALVHCTTAQWNEPLDYVLVFILKKRSLHLNWVTHRVIFTEGVSDFLKSVNNFFLFCVGGGEGVEIKQDYIKTKKIFSDLEWHKVLNSLISNLIKTQVGV